MNSLNKNQKLNEETVSRLDGLKSFFGFKNKSVDRFYEQQCNLLENFKKDSKQVQNNQKDKIVKNYVTIEEETSKNLFDKSTINNIPEILNEDKTNFSNQNGNVSSSRKKRRKPCLYQVSSFEDKKVKIIPSIKTRHLALITLVVNLLLTISKGVASYLSGSLSIISSLVDSLVDITSGVVIWLTSRAIRKHDPYLYPVGRRRLEPVALHKFIIKFFYVIVSVIMGVASAQMVVQSLESIINNHINPRVSEITLLIMVSTIVVKTILFLCCYRTKDPSIKVLALDHRNDCLSNAIALFCAYFAQKFWIYLDSIGAIIVAVYIAFTWFRTGKEQLIMLSGKSAAPELINRIIKLCIDHDDRIDFIDTVYVYHFGIRFLVEVHIVMDENMKLKEAHDISEMLQTTIESLAEVERAFVHVDYEFTHKPGDEHRKP